jgi:hypothetical protein
MAAELSKDDLDLLIRAAQLAGINPSGLKVMNPWLDHSPTAAALQAAITRLDPAAAERLAQTAETPLTLATAAYLEGVGPLTNQVLEELATKRPATLAKIKAAELQAAQETFLANRQLRTEDRAAMNQQIAAQQQDARVASLNLIRMNPQGR